MIHIILYQPEIAPNTGSIGRMCAVLQARLHLIHPLGFELSEKRLRRAGMDYWKTLDLHEHQSWHSFLDSPERPPDDRLFLLTTKAETVYWDAKFFEGDGLVFGQESSGVPPEVHKWFESRRLKIPQPAVEHRSLNLATSAGIVAYEAYRQCMTIAPQKK